MLQDREDRERNAAASDMTDREVEKLIVVTSTTKAARPMDPDLHNLIDDGLALYQEELSAAAPGKRAGGGAGSQGQGQGQGVTRPPRRPAAAATKHFYSASLPKASGRSR